MSVRGPFIEWDCELCDATVKENIIMRATDTPALAMWYLDHMEERMTYRMGRESRRVCAGCKDSIAHCGMRAREDRESQL